MKAWKQQMEQGFEALAYKIDANPKLFVVPVVVTSLVLALQIFFIQFDTSTEGFLSSEDPSIVQLNKTRDQFGRGDFVLVTIESSNIFSLEFLTKLRRLHEQLDAELPWLDSVDSLITARDTRGTEEGLEVAEMFSPFPETPEELAERKQRVLSNPLFQNLLISADGRFTTMVVKPLTYDQEQWLSEEGLETDFSIDEFDDTDLEIAELDFSEVDESAAANMDYLPDGKTGELIKALEIIISDYRSDNFQVFLGGMPIVTEKLVWTMIWEMLTFLPMAIVTIVLFLAILFRRRVGVQFPMMTVVLTLVSITGTLCLLRFPVQMPMMIIPTFILTVTVGASVHLLTMFFREYDGGADKVDALAYAMGHSGLPILLTSLTTAAGLLSFAGTPIVPLSRLGIFSALGVMVAFVYTLLLIPGLVCLLDVKRKPIIPDRVTPVDKVLALCSHLAAYHYGKIMLLAALAILTAGVGISQLAFSHNPMKWLPEDLEARVAIEKIDANMGGSIPVEIVVDSGRENGLHNPELLAKLDTLTQWLEQYQTEVFAVAKVTGLTFMVKESHRALNEGRDEFYVIPDSEAVVAQEMFLFESSGPEELQPMVDSQFQKTRMAVVMPWIDTTQYRPFLRAISEKFHQELGELATVEITGVVPVLGNTLYGVIRTMAQSYAIAFGVITIMMIVLLSSVKYGLIAMIPNLVPITIMLGTMHLLSMPLDMFTILVASIAIGIAVDDTVHFMHHFQRYLERTGNALEAVRQTLDTSGRAMVTTSIVLCLGFSILMLSSMHNITNFGLLIALTIFMALVADFLLAPAIMIFLHRRQLNLKGQA